MISWIAKLCVLCSMSALGQMILPKGSGRESVRMICGLLMLRMTCESAVELLRELSASADLAQMLVSLMK